MASRECSINIRRLRSSVVINVNLMESLEIKDDYEIKDPPT